MALENREDASQWSTEQDALLFSIIKIIYLSRAKAHRFVYTNNKIFRFPKLSPSHGARILCVYSVAWTPLCVPQGALGTKGTDRLLQLLLLAVLFIIKTFVSEPVVSCLLPTFVKLGQVTC